MPNKNFSYGDIVVSRSAPKYIIYLPIAPEDVPYFDDEIDRDIQINTHSLPKRMINSNDINDDIPPRLISTSYDIDNVD